MVETLIFLGLSAGFSWLLWYDRPARGRQEGLRLLRTLVLIALPWAAFIGAMISNNGDRLTLRVNQLRVPQSVVASAAGTAPGVKDRFQPFLVVGDRPEIADLVVTPYLDQSLSRISMPPDARRFVTIEARRPADTDAAAPMEAQLRVQSFDAVSAIELPGMGVVLDTKQVLPGTAQLVALAPGVTHRVMIQRIESTGRWAERRSFSVTLREGAHPAVELDLGNSLAADAGTCELPRLRLSPMANSDAGEPGFRDPENLVFNGLGAGGANPVIDPRVLGPIAETASLCAQTQTNFLWPNGIDHADARLRLVSQKVFLPWYCCIFAMLCTLATHFLCGRGWREATPERIVVPLLQWLLLLRLLIAVAGYYNDMNLMPWRMLWDGMASYLCIPTLAVVLLRPGTGRALAPLMAGIAVLVAMGFTALLLSLKAIDWTDLPEVLCYVTVALAIARIGLRGEDSPLSIAAKFVARTVRPPVTDGAAEASDRRIPRAFWAGLAIVVVLVVFRLVLAVIGAITKAKLSERLFGMPLSVLYVPGMILAFALLLGGTRFMTRTRAALWLVSCFVAAYVLVPFATHDVGALFVSGWPLAIVIAWFGFTRGQEPPTPVSRLLWSIPVTIPVAFVAAYGLLLLVEGPIPSLAPPLADTVQKAENGENGSRRLGPFIAEANGWDRNNVRMLAFLASDRVEQLGTKFALESLDMTTSLGPLTSDLFGHGYLAPSNVRPPLLDNQYFENVPAVHIIWPLGRLGALGLLVVVMAGAAALRPGEPGDSAAAPEWPTLVSLLARWTFAWAAMYMILANLDWVPFTGKDVYLLAVSSGGDLLEGPALVLLMCTSFAAARLATGGRP